jgi:periplasmic protein TonB
MGEDTSMSTTAVEVKGPNKALFRTAALAGSAVIWGSLGYMALTYVPKYEKPFEPPEVTLTGVTIPPVVIPPPKPPEPQEIVKKRAQEPLQTQTSTSQTPVLTTRASKSDAANPLAGELPSGPVASEPVIFADTGPVSGGREWVEPAIMAPSVPELPPIVEAPPAPKLVINPVRISGDNPTFPTRALDRGISGEVTLSFTVSPTGKVENIDVTGERPSGYGFARAAREAIQGWTFQPQTIDGIPVAYPARYTISFKLED